MTNQEHADNFVALNTGSYIDEDRHYGSQCWDVVAKYARTEYGCTPFPTGSGGAEGLYRIFQWPIPNFFDKIPGSELKAGDIAVWDASFYPPWGHTALVWRREGNTIFVLEQDGSKDPNGDGIADGVSYIAQRLITSKVNGLRPKGEPEMNLDEARELARRTGLLAHMSEAEITAEWVEYHARNIVANPAYAAALSKQLYEGKNWQDFNYFGVHYKNDTKAQYDKGFAEGKAQGGGEFVPAPALFVPKQ
jgi:hypothetical protein